MKKEKKRKSMFEKIVIVLIALLTTGIVTYWVFGEYIETDDKEKETEKKKETPKLTTDSPIAQEIYSWISETNACAEGIIWNNEDYPFVANADLVTTDNMTENDKLALVFRQFELDGLLVRDTQDDDYTTVTINESQIEDALIKVFGSKIYYDKNALDNYWYKGFSFTYDADINAYIGEEEPFGCEGSYPGQDSQLTSVELKNNDLILLVQVTGAIDADDLEISEPIFTTYKYTFSKNADGNYNFVNVQYYTEQ